MDGIFDTSGTVDPKLFEGDSAEGAENQTTVEAQQPDGQNQPEGQQQNAPETGNAPKLFAGKYKTPEEMENAYLEAQRSLTKVNMELSTLKRQSANPQKDTSQPNQQQAQDIDWNEAFKQNPVWTIYQLANAIAEQKVQGITSKLDPLVSDSQMAKNLDEASAKYPDFYDYADKAIEILDGMPDLYNMPNHLEIGYKLAKSDVLAEQAKKAYDAGKQDAYNLDGQKNNVVFDNKTTRETAQKTPEETIVDGIMKAGGGWSSLKI